MILKTSSICAKCNKELVNFMGYIPDVGEVCKQCYDFYITEDEI